MRKFSRAVRLTDLDQMVHLSQYMDDVLSAALIYPFVVQHLLRYALERLPRQEPSGRLLADLL